MDDPSEFSIATLIDDAASAAEFEMEIARALRNSDLADGRIAALIDAFHYYEGHNAGSHRFGPFMTLLDGTETPPPLSGASSEYLEGGTGDHSLRSSCWSHGLLLRPSALHRGGPA